MSLFFPFSSLTPLPSSLTPHSSLLSPHPSLLTPLPSPHPSLITSHLLPQCIRHELHITNQIMHLQPPVEMARCDLIAQLHTWISIVTGLPRIQSSRYQVGWLAWLSLVDTLSSYPSPLRLVPHIYFMMWPFLFSLLSFFPFPHLLSSSSL